jgi:hypothetical protein
MNQKMIVVNMLIARIGNINVENQFLNDHAASEISVH